MITQRQLILIKTKLIHMRGRPQPNQAYVKWWDEQDPHEMESQAVRLTFEQAYRLIGEACQGNWHTVIKLWTFFTT
jgi:hypothetical protein